MTAHFTVNNQANVKMCVSDKMTEDVRLSLKVGELTKEVAKTTKEISEMDISEMTCNLPNTLNWMEQDDDSIVEL